MLKYICKRKNNHKRIQRVNHCLSVSGRGGGRGGGSYGGGGGKLILFLPPGV